MMTPRKLEDLPFAAGLRPLAGPLADDGDYDLCHVSGDAFHDVRAAGARFIECAFSGVTLDGVTLRRSRLTDVWMREVRMMAADLAETGWLDAWLSGCALAGVQAFGSSLRRVTFRGCKLDSVNFRDATLTDVLFEDCVLRSADFGGARLTRVRFPGCELERADFTKVACTDVDLRGAALGITAGYDSLRGTVIDSVQLVGLAPLLARHLGITVEDGA
jgi:uncharacterized protein YjbI with pentapeptide repeats